MPQVERDYMRRGGGKHPASCTCVECTEARLKRQKKERVFNLKLSLQNLPHRLSRGGKLINPQKYNTVNKRLIPKPLIKLILNLLILAGLALLIKHSYQLFTAHPEEPLKESIILILGLALWITIIKLSKSRSGHYWLRYNWTKPSFKLTALIAILILLILTFAGVQPMSTYKDNLFNKLSTYWETQTAKPEETITEVVPPSESSTTSPEIVTPTVVLPVEEPLKDLSWEELKTFLYNDTTDQLEYIFPTFVCENFARTLQENAKEAGWRCALVTVKLEGYPDWFNYGIPSNTGHSLNAFETTDRGLVYIDCTQTAQSGFSGTADKLVNVEIGKEYVPVSIFPTPGWSPEWLSMGTVIKMESVKW